MKRPQLVSRGSVSRLLEAAELAWRRKDFQQNIDLLERASRLDPANSSVLLQLGRVQGLRYDFEAAERSFEKAVRFASNKAEILGAAGQQARDFRGSNLAERYFQRALEQRSVPPDVMVNAAEYFERARRIDEASQLVDQALQSNPDFAPAVLIRARLDRAAGRLDRAEKLLRLATSATNRETRARGWYELGALLDRQARYDEAMAAFLEAKSILRLDAGPHIAGLKVLRERLEKLRSSLTAEHFRRWIEAVPQLQPSRRLALLCGHPRSGTTLLEQVLDSHQEIVSAEETEIFHDDAYVPVTRGLPEGSLMLTVLESAHTEALQNSREAYFRAIDLALGSAVGNRVLIDKNPSLTFLIPAFVRIFPEARFLVALRDPRDVCLSCFMQPFVPLAQATSGYLSLERTVEEYSSLMNMWRAIRPILSNSHIEVHYEDMVEDLESVSRRTLDFLGVNWDERVLQFNQHAEKKMVRSPTYADVAKPVFRRAVGRWRHYQKYLEPFLARLEPFARAFGYES